MSVQFTAQWNGFEQYQVVHTLSQAEETRLTGLGIARLYVDGMDGRSDRTVTSAGDGAVNVGGKSVIVVDDALAATCYIIGDSHNALNWSTTADNYASVNSNGVLAMFNARMGHAFEVIANTALGGKTMAQIRAEQLPAALASNAKYVCFTGGTNDIYSAPVQSGEDTAALIILTVNDIFAAGKVPIWQTPPAYTWTSDSQWRAHMTCSAILRAFAANGRAGLFYDAHAATTDPSDPAATKGAPRAGYTYDNAPRVHANNIGAMYQSKKMAALFAGRIPRGQALSNSFDDGANSAGRNMLPNPGFAGGAAPAGAGVTGLVPTGWTVAWATRNGAGTVAASIVDRIDPDTGIAIAKAVKLDWAGVPAINDAFWLMATGFHAGLNGGDAISGRCGVEVTNPVQTDRIQLLCQANTNETTIWGAEGAGSPAAYLEGTGPLTPVTRKIAVRGAGAAAQAMFAVRIRCSGNGSSGSVLIWLPQFQRN